MKWIILVAAVGLFFSCTSNQTRFERLDSSNTGIDFTNSIFESDSFHVMSYEYIYNGGGVGVGDLNNDGLLDIFFSGNMVSCKAYLNQGDFKFKDITEQFEGLSTFDQWFSGVVINDVNSDGLADIYITSTANKDPQLRRNLLWINQGIGENGIPSFKEMSEKYGIADKGYSVHAGFLDYDLDGDLDLYVLNNVVNDNFPTTYRVKITDGSADNNDQLYRNNGDDTFTNVTIDAGIVYEGYGLGIAIGDLNRDGYPDIYVSNDYMANDLMYINQGDGTFKNEIATYLSYQTKSSMGNDMADINNDGYRDIYTMDMLPEYYTKMKQTINGFSYIFYENDAKYNYEHQYLRNMLHMNNGILNGKLLPFSEVGQMMGIFHTEWSWSPLFADYDNDGDKDLLIANGFPKDLTDKDWTLYQSKVYGFVADEQHVMARVPPVKASNFAYENMGHFHFEKRTKEWGLDIPSYSYGASFADFDNDGDLDYVTNNLDDEAFIYRNNTITSADKPEKNYIRLKLMGDKGNEFGIGSKVEIWSNGLYQYHEHFLSRGYVSSVEPIVHFGLDNNDLIDSIRVIWPTGKKKSVFKNVEPNQVITANEEDALDFKMNKPGKPANLFFVKADSVLEYTHKEGDYIDFIQWQRIIPHKFSQLGPYMAKGDLNGDGQEDLIVGATNTEPTQVFIRRGGEFDLEEIEGLSTRKWAPESDLAIFDVDNDGDNDVVAVSGGYTNTLDKDYGHFLYRNDNGKFTKEELPVPRFISATLRPFDFDHDGDKDLFIGARVKRDFYPLSLDSYLIINEDGEFSESNTFHFSLGMVTDAVWSDYDGDGFEDLFVAREFNSLTILKNVEGKNLEIQKIPGLDSKHGYWYSITAGDFDQDGDDDYLAGNLGENHRFTISNKYPLRIYLIDFDKNGVMAPFMTAYWKDLNDKMVEYPVNYLDELYAQSKTVGSLFETYTMFSETPADDILKYFPEERERPVYLDNSSSYVLWNEEGKFRWERLPDLCQVAPITKTLVRDFNEDGYPDVLLTGNDHTYDVSTGYYDANKGLVLLSKGPEAGFQVLKSAESGFVVNGQVGSLLYFEGDTSFIVTGINRGKAVVHRVLK